MENKADKLYMRRAIELALKGEGFVNPNPMVGAVIVKDGRVIGEGYHHRYGDLHAERDAISSLTEDASGATIYVTLEPCCHHGKQPPCTEAIIEKGIKKVVIGSRDPNPLVSGGGVKILKEAGIEVVEDFLKDECDEINPVFFKYISTGHPYVVIKYAMTMDGKIATVTGASKWITGEESRHEVHRLRHKYSAIMAGIGTVLADDPMLNVRIEGLKSPVRVIVDSSLRIPTDSNIVKTACEYRTIVAYCRPESPVDEVRIDGLHKFGGVCEGVGLDERICVLAGAGVELIEAPWDEGRVDLSYLMRYLGEQGIDSVFVEGGGTLNDSLIRSGLVDRVEAFIAPKIFGGMDALSPVEGTGIREVSQAQAFKLLEVTRHGEDIQLTYINEG
ncbi:MAG: bifunctional diaminohydroxyphosphoribosylaminopyrimidine deaminase/5-amino-6-(5-phosphoribosylamino)uracil reductase RibD [Lachnospiraceae bacterium]|nr:bifunctional diaminohydroxyphosphoribosylaminopyrimidine deaminase/5-amino-6-(5-phosphoribosylamino)uracil reductase RibD [Lachnospiraceae bacterium]